jgi:hypothetical protein
MANAMVRTVKPKANATPTKAIPRCVPPGSGGPAGSKEAARTALPQPPKTSQKVPKNSARARFEIGIRDLLFSVWFVDDLLGETK